ncbi:unnamed protein product [Aphanomyces euteiches]|uniref:Oxidation resistance protein 1 n=1 Tax=Aphanomyces euteiches TaxID=100861 RepID=A0A6G0X8S8_9STRA|nr:hypothetical protein Ae201684_007467 [Aphanomyces euteiches]KAH9156669.1 hypothetical protein AeRB84_001470 [Aphanomyces euteiches]
MRDGETGGETVVKVTTKACMKLTAPSGKFEPLPSAYSQVAAECRKGIPDQLRARVWLYLCCKNEVTPSFVTASFGAAMNQVFGTDTPPPSPNTGHPSFGGQEDITPYEFTQDQVQAFRRLCVLMHHVRNVVYCPQLLDLIPIFLKQTSEAATFVALSALVKEQEPSKLPTTRAGDVALVRFFKETLEWRYPNVAKAMQAVNADSDNFFLDLFHRFFVGFFPLPVVWRVVDWYLADGPKVLCRVLLAAIKLSRKAMQSTSAQGAAWWQALQAHVSSPSFDFDAMFQAAARSWYGFLFKKQKIQRMHNVLHKRASLNIDDHAAGHRHHAPLAMAHSGRLLQAHRDAVITSWLPVGLHTKRLRLLYDGDVHGRHLDRLYAHCKSSTSEMLLLVDVLDTDLTIGVFTSHPLARQPSFFGDQRCFPFQLTPTPTAYKLPRSPTSGVLKYMLCLPTLMSFGISSQSTAAALELDQDLMRGKSDASDLFMSPALAGDVVEFDVGAIEVYDFVL